MKFSRAMLPALLAAAAESGAPSPQAVPEVPTVRPPQRHRIRHRNKPPRLTLAKLLGWDREALGLKQLPVDLHPHVRRRELDRRALESPLAGTGKA
jgi:hypothetical protein